MKVSLPLMLALAALAATLVLVGCQSTQEAGPPIRIGVLASLTGSLATNEEGAVHGMELAFSEVNNEVAGRTVQLIVEDAGLDPGLCLTKVQKLYEMDHVDLVLGPCLSSQGLAIRDYIDRNKLITISHFCSSPAFLEESASRYFFRSSHNSGRQPTGHSAYIPYAVKGYRTAACVALDYKAGHDEMDGFKQVFEGLGGNVTQEIYAPIGTADYGPYVARIDLENADFVWSFLWGDDAVRFVKALDQYGIKQRVALFFTGAATVEPPDLWAEGDSALGIEDASHYSPALNTPANNAFVQAIRDRYHEEPTIYTEHGYVAARMAILALQKVNGNTSDPEAPVAALEGLNFEAPRGPIKFDQGHSPTQNVYHRVVEKVDGKLQNTVIGVYNDIGPYWLPPELRQAEGG